MQTILGLIYLVLVIIGIMDCLKNQKDNTKKILWILLILFIPYIGVAAYFFIGKKQA